MAIPIADWVMKHKSVIITSKEPYKIGQVLHQMGEMVAIRATDNFVELQVHEVQIDLIVDSVADQKAYIDQMRLVDPTVSDWRFTVEEYFYKLRLLVQ